MNVTLRGIGKRFGPLTAVEGVDLDIRAGEVLALLGENGAGKSTLAKILYGVHRPDAGQVLVDGHPKELTSPRAARTAGVGMLFQQLSLIPTLTVAENLMLAWPQASRWLPPRAPVWKAVATALAEIAPGVDPGAHAGDLSAGERQLVDLAKVLSQSPRLLILDEPTSLLARPDAERLWARIRAQGRAGTAVVLITHKLADVEACADRVAVMRAGHLVGETTEVGAQDRIVSWMMGAHPSPAPQRVSAPHGACLLSVRGVAARDGDQRLDCPALDVASGEVLGVAGVTGNGQELLGRVLAGVAAVERGAVLLDGRDVAARAAAGEAQARVGYIPEQPAVNGCAPELSVLANVEALEARRMRFIPRWDEARDRATRLLDRFDVRPRQLEMRAGALSGGNLQKLVVGRELSRAPRLVVACYPTMGLDLGAAEQVVAHLLDAAARGAAVVWIGEDLDLLLAHADRVAVMHDGRLRGPLPAAAATRQGLGAWMTGAEA